MERYGINRDHAEMANSVSCPTQYSGEDEYSADWEQETDADPLLFNRLCSKTVPPRNKAEEALSDASWEPVREWLRNHSFDELRQAANQLGDSHMTALHLCCRQGASIDIIDAILSVARSTAQLPDSFGWLPIHYACACGATSAVIKRLAEEFPESKTTVDRRGRTPLHFALGNPDQFTTPEVVAILSSGGAVSMTDKDGMLPLHYACAFGTSEEALHVLTDAYPDSIHVVDFQQRSPLHYVLSNAGRKTSPGAVRHLLNLDSKLVNSLDGGPLPLCTLAEFAIQFRGGENEKQNVTKCLEHLLHADPDPTADFFTALHGLPRWLSEKAVIMAPVQELLNEKTSQRVPTLLDMIEFFALVVVIATYSVNVVDYIEEKTDDENKKKLKTQNLIPLYVGVAIFILREFIQIWSLFSVKSYRSVLFNTFRWINILFCGLVLCWTIMMNIDFFPDEEGIEKFRIGTAFTCIFIYLKVLAFLRNMLIDFAVFMDGVVFLVKRLFPFFICLACIIVAFAQMFLTVFQGTPYCSDTSNSPTAAPTAQCPSKGNEDPVFCDWVSALLTLYSMLLGEVDESMFQDSRIAVWLFVGFMFLVVILLANVLIAIIVDSYKIVQNQRAAIVFWTNRLDKVAEMNAITSVVGLGSIEQSDARAVNFSGTEFWKRLIDLFDEIEEDYTWSEFWMNVMPQRIAAFCIIPSWLVLGFVSAGWLWPPQVRDFIFTSAVSRYSSDSEKEDELRKTQVVLLEKEVKDLREVFAEELVIERTQVVQMKSQIDQKIIEIESDLKSIMRMMQMLFEQQTSVT